jgi:hypothetical protein
MECGPQVAFEVANEVRCCEDAMRRTKAASVTLLPEQTGWLAWLLQFLAAICHKIEKADDLLVESASEAKAMISL